MFQTLIEKAQYILETRFLFPCKISAYDQLSEPGRRNVILRLHLKNQTKNLPKTVILKQSLPEDDSQEDNETYTRFARDWAGLEFLSLMQHTEHFAPAFYGGDIEQRFVLIEDLGINHISLVDALTMPNQTRAIQALTRYISAVAGMHAASFRYMNEYEALFKRIHSQAPSWQENMAGRRDYLLSQLQSSNQCLGLTITPELVKEVETVIKTMLTPGPFTVLTHGDICPDNVFDHQSSKELQLIDFEYASPKHALLDGTYLRMSMPTCWCAKAVPSSIIESMETLYRQKLATALPAARDTVEYQKAYIYACGFWVLQQTLHFIEDTLSKDRIGPSGPTPTGSLWELNKNMVRPRVISRLQAFIDVATLSGNLPHLTRMSKNMLSILLIHWPDTKPLEFYPAFWNE